MAEGVSHVGLLVLVALMEIHLANELQDAGDDDCEDERVQRQDEKDEERVIVLADARSKPNAVMIELVDAVVAQVAVSGLRRAENQARFAELHRCDSRVAEVRPKGRLALVDKIEDALALMFDVDVLGVELVSGVL